MPELARLRHRFILILMGSVSLVLTVVLIASIVTGFSSQYGRIQSSLDAAMAVEGDRELRPFIGGFGGPDLSGPLAGGSVQGGRGGDPSQTVTDTVPMYVVDIASNTGKISYYGSAAEMDEDTLVEALSRIDVETDSDSRGAYLDLGLFYSVQDLPHGELRIAFADASQLYNTTLSQSLIALLIWVLAMVAFYCLGRVLSRMALRPVEQAWSKQHQFIADASHELKTPLTIVLANNNIVMAHPEKTMAEQQQWLESTEEETTRMNSLVTDLLMLAQVEDAAGASEASVDLSTLVKRSLLQFDAVFFERGLASEAEIEEGLHTRGNQEHLRRLIDILLDNASKYGNTGGTVAVRLAHSAHKPHSAILTVSNSGAVIPPEKISRVFERFYRVDEAHSTAVEGSGLGLALAQEIVWEHEGSISVTSVPLDAAVPPEDSAKWEGAPQQEDSAPDKRSDGEQLAQTTFVVTLPLSSPDL
ncbi:MAG: hypothetical protein LBL23_07960 [Coriobacteriales bacterium]|jgi:signal transduction histidine kinase|nr:hypothetical protein [Coriobacteriales bacterium]